MSTYYTDNEDTESTSAIFYKRVMYNETTKAGAATSDNPSTNIAYDPVGVVTDFNFAEKFLYGRVSQLFVPMECGSNRLKRLSKTDSSIKSLGVIDFVADAFTDMAAQFEKCSFIGQINPKDPYLSHLIPVKAYEKPRVLYSTYYDNYTQAFVGNLASTNTQIENFDQLMKELMISLQGSAHKYPFTYPAYIKSRFCPISVSGLTIEIADLDPGNDQVKIDKFYKSLNWEFYLNACRTYGFMVDKFIPWRLVADIGSSPMIQYAANYGESTSTTDIFRRYYAMAYSSYYRGFKERLLVLYNATRPSFVMKPEECNGTIRSTVTIPRAYTLDYLGRTYTEDYFLDAYCRIRFLEEETQFSDSEKRLLIDDVKELAHSISPLTAVAQFERFINKPFDYRGSMSYYKIRRELLLATE